MTLGSWDPGTLSSSAQKKKNVFFIFIFSCFLRLQKTNQRQEDSDTHCGV
jgi:hypothetical protein